MQNSFEGCQRYISSNGICIFPFQEQHTNQTCFQFVSHRSFLDLPIKKNEQSSDIKDEEDYSRQISETSNKEALFKQIYECQQQLDNIVKTLQEFQDTFDEKQLSKSLESERMLNFGQQNNLHSKVVKKQKNQRWSPDEDVNLLKGIRKYGKKWSLIAQSIYKTQQGLPNRCQKSVRERYVSILNPKLSKLPWTEKEDEKLLQLVAQQGYKWSDIANVMGNRSRYQVKSRFISKLKCKSINENI